MYAYQVNDMTCGHCVSAITKAVLAVDSGATVDVDLAGHIVRIESSNAADEVLKQAIQGAGYKPIAVKPTVGRPAAQRTGGCCCGTGAARCSA